MNEDTGTVDNCSRQPRASLHRVAVSESSGRSTLGVVSSPIHLTADNICDEIEREIVERLHCEHQFCMRPTDESSSTVAVRYDEPWHLFVPIEPVVLSGNKVILQQVQDIEPSKLKRARREAEDVSPAGEEPEISLFSPATCRAQLSEPRLPILTPKYISRSSSSSFRIQISAGSREAKNRKFSRNIRNELDALWLCEYALIFLDNPQTLEDIVAKGNYDVLKDRGLVTSVSDFGFKLHEHLLGSLHRGLLKQEEFDVVAATLRRAVPPEQSSHMYSPVVFVQPPSDVMPSPNPTVETSLRDTKRKRQAGESPVARVTMSRTYPSPTSKSTERTSPMQSQHFHRKV
eukprot:CAMPEP_0185025834 /NCGR_PEP_ID=MMETSP1103-20130426/9404_1 /TAXON_ID=36769 /ORGANISM="Paraphysomonas bandaiensis, Strain Caron Lab Isolate" /LENGTH=345 /DNA_ID=CAMNT_0027559203 /DNA_START=123 /DNA_END=1160 /DNA_ORIENTATION=+